MTYILTAIPSFPSDGVYDIDINPNSDSGDLILRIGQNLTCLVNGTGKIEYKWICSDRKQKEYSVGSKETVQVGQLTISYHLASFAFESQYLYDVIIKY